MANEMTVKELLMQVKDSLSKVRVPCSEMQEIGMPIAQAITALGACINAINEAEAKNAPHEEPEIELLPVEDVMPVEDGEPDA